MLNMDAKIAGHEFYYLVNCVFDFEADQSFVGLAFNFDFAIHPVELLVAKKQDQIVLAKYLSVVEIADEEPTCELRDILQIGE